MGLLAETSCTHVSFTLVSSPAGEMNYYCLLLLLFLPFFFVLFSRKHGISLAGYR